MRRTAEAREAHSFNIEDKMKTLIYGFLLVGLTLLSLPTTADAFSRRSHGSEVTQSQAVTVPLKAGTIETRDVSPTAVPEPPVLLLMGIGLGVFASCSAIWGCLRQA
jgi:hypothetical protein